MTQVIKTGKVRLYHNRRNKRLHRRLDVAGLIGNHMVALQRRTYRLSGKDIGRQEMQRHLARFRKRAPRFAHGQLLGGQAVQELAERHDRAYRHFFAYKRGAGSSSKKNRHGRPRFKKVRQYPSFTLKQAGWQYAGDNWIVIQGTRDKFSLSRPVESTIKTVTVKRDRLGQLWIYFPVVLQTAQPLRASTGHSGGFDFGLQAFLTDHEGRTYHSPPFLRSELSEMARLNRELARKQTGSNNRRKARWRLGRAHARIADKRQDARWKLARRLCARFDLICLETLRLEGMKRPWARQVSDLGFAESVGILQQVVARTGTEVVPIDRWRPTSRTCASCGLVQEMPLAVRHFDCPRCGWPCARDQNAARNILAAGLSAAAAAASAVGLGDVRRAQLHAVSA